MDVTLIDIACRICHNIKDACEISKADSSESLGQLVSVLNVMVVNSVHLVQRRFIDAIAFRN